MISKNISSLIVATAMITFVVTGIGVAATSKAAKTLATTLQKEIKSSATLTPKVKTFAANILVKQIDNKVFASAAAKQNQKKVPLSEIKKLDKSWIDAEEELPLQKALQSNKCAAQVKKLVQKYPAILEAFVMDNQGAVVCENALTSDYWQGDEAKWKNSYKGGKGGLDAGKVEFDKSANSNLQQISLPLVNSKGKVIGAITYGVNVDKL